MFGLGNKKRIEELERQVEVLTRRENNNILNEAVSSMDSAFKDYLVFDVPPIKPGPCKCESCGINTNGETFIQYERPSGFGAISIKVPIKISAASAIEKIMDHLGLEFDHVEATGSDTVIKPKEDTES